MSHLALLYLAGWWADIAPSPSETLLGKGLLISGPGAPTRSPFLQAWLSFLGVTGSAYKDINGQPARETGLAAKTSERQVGMQQPTCLNWSQGASRWPAPGLDRAFPAGLVSLLDPSPGVVAEGWDGWGRRGTSGFQPSLPQKQHCSGQPSSQSFLPSLSQNPDLCTSATQPSLALCLSLQLQQCHTSCCRVQRGAFAANCGSLSSVSSLLSTLNSWLYSQFPPPTLREPQSSSQIRLNRGW